MRLPPPPPNATTAEANPFTGLPTIFTVLGKLGLELKRQEDTLPVYTVERIERPAANDHALLHASHANSPLSATFTKLERADAVTGRNVVVPQKRPRLNWSIVDVQTET